MNLNSIRYVAAVAAALAAMFAAPAVASAQPDIHAAAGAVNPRFPEVSLCTSNPNFSLADVTGTNQNGTHFVTAYGVKLAPGAGPGHCTLVGGYWWDVNDKLQVLVRENNEASRTFPAVDLKTCPADQAPGKNIRYCYVN